MVIQMKKCKNSVWEGEVDGLYCPVCGDNVIVTSVEKPVINVPVIEDKPIPKKNTRSRKK